MFGSVRILSLISLIVSVIIVIAAGFYLRESAGDDLVMVTEKNIQGIAQAYTNAVWAQHQDVVPMLSSGDAQQLKNPQVIAFAKDTMHFFEKLPLLRANIYNVHGALLLTVNTTGPGPLPNAPASVAPGYITSHLGQMHASQLLAGKSNEGDDKKIMQVLVAIQGPSSHATEGMLEVVCDISEPWKRLTEFQLYGTLVVIALFMLFLGLQQLASQRAESIIAKQHEANMELAAAAQAAQAENYEKSQFLANVSHELRTPLNAIIGFSEIMKNEIITIEDEKYHHYINDIHSSGVHLLSLINDILDYSKAEAGKLELEVSEVNAFKMIQNSMRLVMPRAELAEVKLVDNLPKEQFIMTTDSKKFKQVLLNLLSNAVKFTPAGGEVCVTAWRNVADDTFSFEVRDTGIGIAPKDISIAMSPFGQVDNSLRRKYEGTGLGLPLTKKFVELMGGKFTIESQVGHGTTIVFILPREIKERPGLVIKQM